MMFTTETQRHRGILLLSSEVFVLHVCSASVVKPY
jgi:hypothetical protein